MCPVAEPDLKSCFVNTSVIFFRADIFRVMFFGRWDDSFRAYVFTAQAMPCRLFACMCKWIAQTFIPRYQSIFADAGNRLQLPIAVKIQKNQSSIHRAINIFCKNDWGREMPIEWVAVSQHVYSGQPELASADGKNINCDDKNCRKCTLCRSEYFATASDYLSLLWKAPSIRATWSPSSSRKNSWGRAVSYRRPATDSDSGCLLCLPPLSSATAEALYNVYTHTHTDLDMDKVWLLGTLDGGNTQKRNSDVTDFACSVSRDVYCGCIVKHMVPWGNRLRASLPTNWFTLAKRAITTSLPGEL